MRVKLRNFALFLLKLISKTMKISLLVIGKTDDKTLAKLTDTYRKRIKHFVKFEYVEIPDVQRYKKISEEKQKQLEAEVILKHLPKSHYLILLDEKGKQYSSVQFSEEIQRHIHTATQNLVFVVGGPYGFAPELYEKCHAKLSLSKMTFSHQMIRLFFTEQIYRAMSIWKNLPYHHE